MKKRLLFAIFNTVAASMLYTSITMAQVTGAARHAHEPRHRPSKPLSTPEIDSELMLGGLVLGGAGLALVSEKRRRRKAIVIGREL
ncbi:MAG TPA: hypothetical protein VMT61_10220 [Candidatus Binataceae bacterium]|nr:hypothetical protein [Candidatus Binataceae bacterium]